MNTFIADKNTGKIHIVFSGPKDQHNTEQFGEDFVAIEWIGESDNKKAELIDGTWQIVDDIGKLIESAKETKINEIREEKSKLLDGGLTFSGEEHNGTMWIPSQVTIDLRGNDYTRFRQLAERLVVNSKLSPEDEDGKLLHGRQNFKFLLPGKRRIIFNTAAEAATFVEQFEDKIALADIIEQEKISAVYDLQEIESINSYDAADWGELNG